MRRLLNIFTLLTLLFGFCQCTTVKAKVHKDLMHATSKVGLFKPIKFAKSFVKIKVIYEDSLYVVEIDSVAFAKRLRRLIDSLPRGKLKTSKVKGLYNKLSDKLYTIADELGLDTTEVSLYNRQDERDADDTPIFTPSILIEFVRVERGESNLRSRQDNTVVVLHVVQDASYGNDQDELQAITNVMSIGDKLDNFTDGCVWGTQLKVVEFSKSYDTIRKDIVRLEFTTCNCG